MRRGIGILLIAIVVLGGLFIAADRLAVSYAESKAADKIQSARGLTHKPSVSIKGFPFLTQVAARDLDEVTVSVNYVTTSTGGGSANGSDTLGVARFTADLHNVRINGGSASASAVADTATGSTLIPYSAVSKIVAGQLSGTVSDITVSYGGTNSSGQGQLKISGKAQTPYLGVREFSSLAQITVKNHNALAFSFSSGLEQLVGGEPEKSWPLSGLPSGMTLSGVQVTPQGIAVSLAGTNIGLAG